MSLGLLTVLGVMSVPLAVLSAATIQVDEGHDVLLPCRLDPEADVSESPVTWSKDEARNVVHAHVRGHDLPRDQKDEFRNRTRLDHGALRKGDASLRLFSVRPSDSGDYFCYIQRLDRLIPSVLRVVRRNQTSRTTAMMSPLDDVTEAPDDESRTGCDIEATVVSIFLGILGAVILLIVGTFVTCKKIGEKREQKEASRRSDTEMQTLRREEPTGTVQEVV